MGFPPPFTGQVPGECEAEGAIASRILHSKQRLFATNAPRASGKGRLHNRKNAGQFMIMIWESIKWGSGHTRRIPVAELETGEHTEYHNQRLDHDGEPVLLAQRNRETAQDYWRAFLISTRISRIVMSSLRLTTECGASGSFHMVRG